MPSQRSLFKFCLTVALTLATAWAIRGQFGHEQGAAWAGGLGMLAVVLLSGRKHWYARMPAIVAVGALAWGVGGVMSYGKVVGYGKATDFPNVLYGLAMLLVIGGLYGFIGGGLSGLALEGNVKRKISWASLLTQMVAGAFLFWGMLVYQLGYYMTPPRSEAWAGCLGAAFALGWFLYREGYHSSLRVALYTALGAGFGFAFGNFIQTLGAVSGISFNWWNAMEYSLGFFGGTGMAYGIARERWPVAEAGNGSWLSNLAGGFTLIILLPVFNLVATMTPERLSRMAEPAGYQDTAGFVAAHQWIAWGLSAAFACLLTVLAARFCRPSSGHKLTARAGNRLIAAAPDGEISAGRVRAFFFCYFVWYVLLSNLVGGTWILGEFSSQHLYWVNLLIILLLSRPAPSTNAGREVTAGTSIARDPAVSEGTDLATGTDKTRETDITEETNVISKSNLAEEGSGPALWIPEARPARTLALYLALVLLLIVILSLISFNLHEGLPGSQYRFGPHAAANPQES